MLSELVFEKTGPLAQVWIAAHNESKLKKSQIMQADLKLSVKALENSSEPLALRLSAHLLLGIVRIFLQKAKYLYRDLNRTVIRIRMGSGLLSKSSITLKNIKGATGVTIINENHNKSLLALDESNTGDLSLSAVFSKIEASISSDPQQSVSHVSRVEDITLTPQKSKKRSSIFDSSILLSGKTESFNPVSWTQNLEITPTSRSSSRRKKFKPGTPISFDEDRLDISLNSTLMKSIEMRRDADADMLPSAGMGEGETVGRLSAKSLMQGDVSLQIDTPNFGLDMSERPNSSSEEQKPVARQLLTTFEDMFEPEKTSPTKRIRKKRKKGIKVSKNTMLSSQKLSSWRKDSSKTIIHRILPTQRCEALYDALEYGLGYRMVKEPYFVGFESVFEYRDDTLDAKFNEDNHTVLKKLAAMESEVESPRRGSQRNISLRSTGSERHSYKPKQSLMNATFDNSEKPGFDVDFEFDALDAPNLDNTIVESAKKSSVEEDTVFSRKESTVAPTVITGEGEKLANLLGKEGSFFTVTKGLRRKHVAKIFHTLLVLKTKDRIAISQEAPFEDILYHSIE